VIRGVSLLAQALARDHSNRRIDRDFSVYLHGYARLNGIMPKIVSDIANGGRQCSPAPSPTSPYFYYLPMLFMNRVRTLGEPPAETHEVKLPRITYFVGEIADFLPGVED